MTRQSTNPVHTEHASSLLAINWHLNAKVTSQHYYFTNQNFFLRLWGHKTRLESKLNVGCLIFVSNMTAWQLFGITGYLHTATILWSFLKLQSRQLLSFGRNTCVWKGNSIMCKVNQFVYPVGLCHEGAKGMAIKLLRRPSMLKLLLSLNKKNWTKHWPSHSLRLGETKICLILTPYLVFCIVSCPQNPKGSGKNTKSRCISFQLPNMVW